MICLNVTWQDNRITRFSLSGHADFADSGKDIVCSAVSALTYNAVNSCERFAGIVLEVHDELDLVCQIPDINESGKAQTVQLLVQSMVFGMEQIENQYPEHLKIVSIR